MLKLSNVSDFVGRLSKCLKPGLYPVLWCVCVCIGGGGGGGGGGEGGFKTPFKHLP